MKRTTLVALPLAIALCAGLAESAPAVEPARAAKVPFVAADTWKVEGYGSFKAGNGPSGTLPACETLKGLAKDTPKRFFTARKASGGVSIHAAQYVVELPNVDKAVSLADKLAETVRTKCAAKQRRSPDVQADYFHRYHVKQPVHVANGGGPPPEDTIAVWSTGYRDQLVEIFNGADGTRQSGKDATVFGSLTVVAVGRTGAFLTVLVFALEETVEKPPWKALRNTTRAAMRLLVPDAAAS